MKYKVTYYSNALCSGRVVRQNEVIIGGKNVLLNFYQFIIE